MTQEPAGEGSERADRDGRDHDRIHACNRILLYGQGLDLSAETCLKLAEESLRRAPEGATLPDIMTAMHQILAERDIGVADAPAAHVPFASYPPVGRHSMVSEGPDCRSFLGWLASGGKFLVNKMAVHRMGARNGK